MRIGVCTSFSQQGFVEYGERCILSFYRYWPKAVDLHIFSEHLRPKTGLVNGRKQVVHDSLQDIELCEFLARAPKDTRDYRWKVRKFAYKVFAITNKIYKKYDLWIWLDADTETIRPVDDALFEAMTGNVNYLGREEWHTSECGWVAYRGASRFLDRFREVYVSGEIYEHNETHDSYVFDRVREEVPLDYNNLSKGVPGLHVWDDTILGKYMKHYKGPLRKKGVHVDIPGYWSKHESLSAT